MPKDTAIDLSLISTEELIDELTERHEEIIIVREDRKDSSWLNIRAKTNFCKHSNPNAGFDLIRTIAILHSAEEQLAKDYLNTEDSDSDSPQNPQEGG